MKAKAFGNWLWQENNDYKNEVISMSVLENLEPKKKYFIILKSFAIFRMAREILMESAVIWLNLLRRGLVSYQGMPAIILLL